MTVINSSGYLGDSSSSSGCLAASFSSFQKDGVMGLPSTFVSFRVIRYQANLTFHQVSLHSPPLVMATLPPKLDLDECALLLGVCSVLAL